MLNNPQVYPDPDKFVPERFLKDGKLNPEIRDPTTYLFGFGRRYETTTFCWQRVTGRTHPSLRFCPGRHFADASVFIQIASMLHSFNISPPLDDNGLPIHIEPRSGGGLVS